MSDRYEPERSTTRAVALLHEVVVTHYANKLGIAPTAEDFIARHENQPDGHIPIY